MSDVKSEGAGSIDPADSSVETKVAPPEQDPKEALHRMAVELGPIFVFVLVNWWAGDRKDLTFFGMETETPGVIWGTFCFMIANSIAIIYSWLRMRHVAPLLWVSFVFILIFGGLTLYFNDKAFIQIKPTIVNLLFGGALLGGYAFKQYFLKNLFGMALGLQDIGWRKLTLYYGVFFIFLAGLNEVFRYAFSFDMWLKLKFANFAISLVFSVFAISRIQKYVIADEVTDQA